MNNVNEQISRMKAMMTYGLKTENKSNQYSGIEYQREGADGKLYGIVREGTKYYIKVSNKITNALNEDFNYIGGFRNRKDNEYSSYANALKNFEMKMSSIKEAVGNKEPIIESWNPDKKEMLAVEATDKMRREIARQRQIMANTSMIQEKKNYEVNLDEACCGVNKECSATQKNNIKKTSDGKGEPTGKGGDPFTKKVDSEHKATQKTNVKKEFKPVMEGDEVLGWNDNKDYLDTSKGTEVGDDAPFTETTCCSDKEMENGTVEEGTAMHNTDNQNSPAVGVGEIGDDAPFTEKAKDSLKEGMDDEPEFGDDEEPEFGAEDEPEFGDNESEFGEEEPEMGDEEFEDEVESDDNDIEARLSSIEDMIYKIADKLDISEFDTDDKLYDDDEDDTSDEDFEDDNEFGEEEPEMGDDEDEFEVYESVNYRKMMSEDRLDYFGKHPAYQKEPMKLPTNKHQEMPEYYDMNDESVENEQPFGQKIGDSAPFKINPQDIENAIAESVKRILKKKI